MLSGAYSAMSITPTPLLQVKDLALYYQLTHEWFEPAKTVHALEKITFDLHAGQTLAVVGESGCGKSTLGKAILGLINPTEGEVFIDGELFSGKGVSPTQAMRKKVQMVFQDPYSSLNPRRTIFQTVADPLRTEPALTGSLLRARVIETLGLVGFGQDFLERHPHELSGGQRQRVAIARALVMRPKLIVCDEPVSSLDISIQAQVINLLERLQRELGVAYLFITHDLRLVPHIADRVLVMYMGQVVEATQAKALERERLHPYSKALFSAIPRMSLRSEASPKRVVLQGEVPSPLAPPEGCRFHTRCPQRELRCEQEPPALRQIDERLIRCHFVEATQTNKGDD